ncbi:hypothetical protein X798_01053 [Onchocerca flexuosa]|uniref:Uncharacterized protein n=2 Tax=Onchocerca flexuosa TaxID=387005 RepID=A0A183H1D4_9BILA|nr:hypothetical protein X798_01053 [Onchocerca flexuosa]VDO28999.1 unnamed protein product [Onchocerca flexuosa]
MFVCFGGLRIVRGFNDSLFLSLLGYGMAVEERDLEEWTEHWRRTNKWPLLGFAFSEYLQFKALCVDL